MAGLPVPRRWTLSSPPETNQESYFKFLQNIILQLFFIIPKTVVTSSPKPTRPANANHVVRRSKPRWPRCPVSITQVVGDERLQGHANVSIARGLSRSGRV